MNHSAHRAIDDIVVPGSIGKYPLKMTRYYNSRRQYYAGQPALSPGWGHEYGWLQGSGNALISPQGNVYDPFCGNPVGVSEYWEGNDWRLADGGRVHFDSTTGRATYIQDPYGQRTTIDYSNNRTWRVTEPGGRCLIFTYGPTQDRDGTTMLTKVEAYDHYNGNLIDSVNYSYHEYNPIQPLPPNRQPKMMLTGVSYSDHMSATYDYRTDNVLEGQSSHKMYPLLQRADDVRYNGPMRTIRYEYQGSGPHGAIVDEKCPDVGAVSAIAPGIPVGGAGTVDSFTETRGDSPTRRFNYTHIHHCQGTECGPCDDYGTTGPNQQMLLNYTDFQGHTTTLDYDRGTDNEKWYVKSVTDANGNTTLYDRGDPPPNGIGEILTITHPAGVNYLASSVHYIYSDHGHYITSIRDENDKTTTLHRDGQNRIYQIDYPSDTYTPGSNEVFTYNPFGQVQTHQLKNGAWENFVYDPRGLLTDKYNPKQTGVPGGSDPHTHYTYYTAADGKPGWIDRVKTMTEPAPNWQWSQQASETYEYDRDASNNPVAGRGLVTKITYADTKFKSFSYNQWGNKVNEWNEMGEDTVYAYDNYNRVTSMTRVMYGLPNEVTTYTYNPTNGGNSPYLHTTNNPDTITLPTNIVTSNVYDQNFRRTSTTVAGLTTWFQYDPVGNLQCVTDPRGTGPCSSTYTTTTDYDTRNRKWHVLDAQGHQTTFTYDPASNDIDILRPDNTHETKTYDAMNRVLTDTVPFKTGPTVNLTTWFTYNPSGTIQKVTDARGSGPDDPNYTTTFEYNAADQKKKMTYPDGSFRTWDYDDAQRMKTRTAVAGETQDFAFDNRNRYSGKAWENADQKWVILAYDGASQLRRARNGGWDQNLNPTITSDIHHDYDHAGRLTMDQQQILDQPNGPGLATKEVHYEYDISLRGTAGKPTRMYVTGTGYDYDFRYDGMGRLDKILVHGTANPSFQYYYDNASNETQRHNAINSVDQFYNPDSLNRPTTTDLHYNGGQALESYGYYPIGRLQTVTRGSKHDQFTYFLDGELSSVMYGVSGVQAANPDETPPAEDPGKEKTVDDLVSLSGSGSDPNGALTADRTVNYDLDKAGNRNSVNDSVNGTTAYTPNNLNQYLNTIGADAITNGSEHEVAAYKNINYTYIKDEHLISATNTVTGDNYQLAYDALGRCVRRTVQTPQDNPLRPTPTPGPSPTTPPHPSPTPTPSPTPSPGLDTATKYYIYDGDRPIMEYQSDGGLAGKNLYGKGIDEILMRTDYTFSPALTFYYQQDHEGSVIYLTNPDGTLLEKYRYDVFGAPTIYAPDGSLRTASVVSNRFLFTGREYSAMFGFYEYRARAYHPTLGRFMSEDPKLFVHRASLEKPPDAWSFGIHPDEANLNLFRYCENDPIDFTDPMGIDPVGAAIGEVIGGVLGGYAGTDIGVGVGALTGFGAGVESGPGELVSVPVGAITGGVIGGGYGTIKGSEIGRTVGDRVGDLIKQGFGNRLNSSGPVPKPQDVQGKTQQQVRDMMREKGWQESATRRGDGTRFQNPDKKGEQVRIQPGNRSDPDPTKQNPYVRISTQGRVSEPIPLKPDLPQIQSK